MKVENRKLHFIITLVFAVSFFPRPELSFDFVF